MGQLRAERGEVLVRGEVVLRLRPGGDGEHDAVDQLADGRLPLRRAEVAAEVLADDDVRGHLAPERRYLHVLLLEDELARLGADGGGADFPGDLVIGVHAGPGPAALEGEAANAVAGEAERVHRRPRRAVRIVPQRLRRVERDRRALCHRRAAGRRRAGAARCRGAGAGGRRLATLSRGTSLCHHRDDVVCGSCHLSPAPSPNRRSPRRVCCRR